MFSDIFGSETRSPIYSDQKRVLRYIRIRNVSVDVLMSTLTFLISKGVYQSVRIRLSPAEMKTGFSKIFESKTSVSLNCFDLTFFLQSRLRSLFVKTDWICHVSCNF